MLEKNKVIEVNGKSYTIPFPKIRHQFDIEHKKHLLANGTYGTQERANTTDSQFNLNLIDAIAHITVLCPQLIKDLIGEQKLEDVFEMDLVNAKWILKAYSEYLPWYEEIKKEVNSEMGKTSPSKDTAKQ